MSGLRVLKGPASANLFCANCETYIGTFKNEWRHVTSSYALPTLPGERLDPTITETKRIVPNGASSRGAAGCEMADVLCSSCSKTIGQYCVRVRRPDQKYLLHSHLYKLTRVYLMEEKTTKKKGFCFIDEESAKENGNARINELLNTSFASSEPQMSTPLHPMPPITLSSISDKATDSAQDLSVAFQDAQPPIETFMMFSRQMYEHGSAINDNFNRIVTTNGKITRESARINDLEGRITKLDDEMIKLNNPAEGTTANQKINYTRYLQHEKAIQDLLATVEDQKKHIQRLSAELYNIRNQINSKEVKEPTPKPPPRRGPLSGLSPSSTNRVVQDMRKQREQESDREESPILGKRKRTGTVRSRSRKSSCAASNVTQYRDSASIPTPESTQEHRHVEHKTEAEHDENKSARHLNRVEIAIDGSSEGQHEPAEPTGPDIVRNDVDVSKGADAIRRSPDWGEKRYRSIVIEDSPKNTVPPVKSQDSAADAIDFSDDEDTAAVSSTAPRPVPNAPAARVAGRTQKIVAKDASTAITSDSFKLCQEKVTVSLARQKRCLPCGQSGKVLCCSICSECYHLGCLKAPIRPRTLSATRWVCPNCDTTYTENSDIVRTKDTLRNSTLDARLRLAQREMLRSEPSVAVQAES